MTVPRAIVLLCAALALADGAVLEAVGLVLFAIVLCASGGGRRSRGLRFRWHYGTWRQE